MAQTQQPVRLVETNGVIGIGRLLSAESATDIADAIAYVVPRGAELEFWERPGIIHVSGAELSTTALGKAHRLHSDGTKMAAVDEFLAASQAEGILDSE